MSTGPFVLGVAAALVVGASVVSASGEKPKSKHGSHEVAASAYSASFPTVGAMCASGATRASRDTLNNPFAGFGGKSAYAQMFFNAGFNAGVRAAGGGVGSSRGSLTSVPSSGRPGNGNGRAPSSALVTLPARGGAITTLGRGTPAIGANAQALLAAADVTPSATPEPATLLLLTTGIGGVFFARRRNRASN